MAAEDKTVTKLNSVHVQKHDAHMDRQKRKKQRLIRRLVLFSIFVAVVFASFTVIHVKQRHVQAEKREQLVQMEKKYAALKKDGKNLQEEVKLLKDEDYVLEIARTNYFFSKKGELIFKIPDDDPDY